MNFKKLILFIVLSFLLVKETYANTSFENTTCISQELYSNDAQINANVVQANPENSITCTIEMIVYVPSPVGGYFIPMILTGNCEDVQNQLIMIASFAIIV